MHVLRPRHHRLLDYVTVIALLGAPTLLSLGAAVAVLAYVLAVVHLALTLLSPFEPAGTDLVSAALHGMVELVVGGVLALAPWLAGGVFEDDGKLFSAVAGVVILAGFVVTDYRPSRQPGSDRAP